MRKHHVKRLERLAAHLESGQLGHEKFFFGSFNHGGHPEKPVVPGCETMGCAIGECPVIFRKDWEFRNTGMPRLRGSRRYVDGDIRKYFGISQFEIDALFYPSWIVKMPGIKPLGQWARPKSVAKNIRKFLKLKQEGKV
jgi:hypothetical protein